MSAAGFLLLLVSLTGAGDWTWDWSRRVNWQAQLPTWYLLRVARASPGVSTPQLVELLARQQDGRLSGEQLQQIEDVALALQADTTRPWNGKWGEFIEVAQRAGTLSHERWICYAQRAVASVDLKLVLRQRVRQGDPLPYAVAISGGRVADTALSTDGTASTLCVRLSRFRLWVDGHRQRENEGGLSTLLSIGAGSCGSAVNANELPPLTPGSVPVRCSVALTVSNVMDGPTLVAANRELTGSFVLEPASATLVRQIPDDDPALRASVLKSVRVTQFDRNSNGDVNINVEFNGVPVGLAYRASVRASDGAVHPLDSSISVTATVGNCGFGLSGRRLPPLGPKADVILTPSPDVAADSVDLHECWMGQIVLNGVSVAQH